MINNKYPVKKDKEDARDYKFKAVRYTVVSDLPAEVDLRAQCSPVGNQGSLGSCTGFGIIKGLREYQLNHDGDVFVPLSALFEYWQERNMEGTLNEDSGAYIRDGMRVLQQIGVCPEADYPYDISKFTQAPSQQAIDHAAQYKIFEYHRVDTYDLMKHALAEGLPVVIGIDVYESFETMDVSLSGMIPVPKPGERNLGGHCMCLFGYKTLMNNGTPEEYVIVRNSWGSGWGQSGYGLLPKSYFDAGYVMDMWTGTVSPPALDPASVDLLTALNALKDLGCTDSPQAWVDAVDYIKANPAQFVSAPLSVLNYLDLLMKKFYVGQTVKK